MYIHESMLNNDKPKIGSANIFTILDVAMMNLACDERRKKEVRLQFVFSQIPLGLLCLRMCQIMFLDFLPYFHNFNRENPLVISFSKTLSWDF